MSAAITVAYGDGASPEIIEASLLVLREAGASLTLETIEIGKRIYAMDYPQGILPSAFDKLNRTKILIKGHVEKPEEPAYREVGDVVREHYHLSNEHKATLSLNDDVAAITHINEHFALFEAAQPHIAAMLLSCVMALEHMGQEAVAIKIRHALEHILSEGLPATSLWQRLFSPTKSECQQFAEAVCARLTATSSRIAS